MAALSIAEDITISQSPVSLRDYQHGALSAILENITASRRSGMVALPTGTGKTLVEAELTKKFLPQCRSLVLAHRQELVWQLQTQFEQAGVPAGVIMADENDIDADVAIGSVQTLSRGKRLLRFLEADPRPIGVLCIDEGHHAAAAGYRRIVDAVRKHSPRSAVVGFSATPYRHDKLSLASVFPVTFFSREIAEMQEAGWLCPFDRRRVVVPMDLAEILFHTDADGNRDYALPELGLEARRPEVEDALIRGTVPYLGTRKTLAFAAGVAHARDLARHYAEAGVPAAAVWGNMDAEIGRGSRAKTLAAWRAGDLQVLVNDSLLVEGFDEPSISCLVLARPTASLPRYIQQLGRGTRLFPGKDDCLILEATAGKPDRRQLTLPQVMPMPVDVADTEDEEDEEARSPRRSPQLVLVDPRRRTKYVWSRYPDLRAFVCPMADEQQLWLVEDDAGLYRLVMMQDRQAIVLHDTPGWGLPLLEALERADARLDDENTPISKKNSRWRRLPISDRQRTFLLRHRFSPVLAREIDDMSMGEASDLIDQTIAHWNASKVRAALAA